MPMTPDGITPEIESFIVEQLGISAPPIYIEVRTDPAARPYSCVEAVENYIRKNQGEMVLGWYIGLWPHILVDAHLHAVWKSPSGDFLDVSFHDPGLSRVLFVADIRLEYHSREKPKVRGLTNEPEVQRYISAVQAYYDFDISNTITTINNGRVAHDMLITKRPRLRELEEKAWIAKEHLQKAEPQIAKRAETRLRRKAKSASSQE